MKYRKLRIAWSVVCGILCLMAFVVLVRNYFLSAFAILAAAATAPWIRRFSLRSLLIATTLVAIVLGLVVWLAR